jgi:hypothetical protein
MKKMVTNLFVALLALTAGCSNSQVATTTGSENAGAAVDGSQFVAATEPNGAVPVGYARQTVKDNDEVTLVGIIGGSSKPFVDGLAAFTIVDPKVPYCQPDEGCPTPWDYCCTMDQVKDNIATVKVVDASGTVVAADARTLLNAKELSTVVVQGKAQRDEQGNLTVAATKVFVRTSN